MIVLGLGTCETVFKGRVFLIFPWRFRGGGQGDSAQERTLCCEVQLLDLELLRIFSCSLWLGCAPAHGPHRSAHGPQSVRISPGFF